MDMIKTSFFVQSASIIKILYVARTAGSSAAGFLPAFLLSVRAGVRYVPVSGLTLGHELCDDSAPLSHARVRSDIQKRTLR